MESKKTLISIDGGLSTGISVGTYSDTEPYRLTNSFQIEGGVEGFLKNVRMIQGNYGEYGTLAIGDLSEVPSQFFDLWDEDSEFDIREAGTVIVEKFTARGGANTGFAYKTRDLEPLRIEGAILAMGLSPHWVSPPQQYFAGGDGKAKKKQAQHKWLKDKGLYVTGKMVDSPNADDVRSSIAHAVAWLMRQKHRPTIEHYFKED